MERSRSLEPERKSTTSKLTYIFEDVLILYKSPVSPECPVKPVINVGFVISCAVETKLFELSLTRYATLGISPSISRYLLAYAIPDTSNSVSLIFTVTVCMTCSKPSVTCTVSLINVTTS